MNIKKGRATRKRCARKCKKRTSRKLRGSRRYGGGKPSAATPSYSRDRSVTSSIIKPRTGDSLLETHIQDQLNSFNKSIHTYPKGNPIRIFMEKRIPKLEQELVDIATDNLDRITLGNKTTSK